MKSIAFVVVVAETGLVLGLAFCSNNNVPPTCTEATCARWPPPPDAGDTTSTNIVTFAIDTVWAGDTLRGSATTSTTAWKAFGFNLDGKNTDKFSKDVCKPAAGSPSSVQTDGLRTCSRSASACTVDGVDNSFGANVVPILQTGGQQPDPSKFVTDLVRHGVYTIELLVIGLDATTRQTARGLSMQIFEGAPFEHDAMPAFFPTEDWPVLGTSLQDPNDVEAGAKYRFESAYAVDGTIVSGVGDLVIGLPFASVVLRVPLRAAIVTMDVSEDGYSVTNGTIAGVLPVEDFLREWQRLAGLTSRSLCGSAFDGIAQQIRQTADMRSDGTNTPGLPCDGISFAIGFEGKRIANPRRVGSLSSMPDPCVSAPDAKGE